MDDDNKNLTAEEKRIKKVDNWATKTSGTFVDWVAIIKEKTTGPALVTSRYLVYLILILLLSIILLVITLQIITRTLIVLTQELNLVDNNEPWLAYLILGTIFCLFGAYFWKLKEPRKGKVVEIDN